MNKIIEFLKMMDLFTNSQYLLYKGDPTYKTATGGFATLSMITIMTLIFFNQGLSVLKK